MDLEMFSWYGSALIFFFFIFWNLGVHVLIVAVGNHVS